MQDSCPFRFWVLLRFSDCQISVLFYLRFAVLFDFQREREGKRVREPLKQVDNCIVYQGKQQVKLMPDLANEKQNQKQRGKKSKRKPSNLGNESGHRQDLSLTLSESVKQEEPAPKYLLRQVSQTEGIDGVKVFCVCGRSSNGKGILVGI